jgi:hypothetical protein
VQFKKLLELPKRESRPSLRVDQVLAWADAHRARTGRWPTRLSGRIRKSRTGMTWLAVDTALIDGLGNLPAGLSIAGLLEKYRGANPRLGEEATPGWDELRRRRRARRRPARPALSAELILAWADAHHAATGRWPSFRSGPIPESPGDTWSSINFALRAGRRGLTPRTSLARLLVEHRGRQALNGPPELTIESILRWADAYHEAHGRWPGEDSGPVSEAPSETWARISRALARGTRGLPGGSSLARLLAAHRGARNPRALLRLSLDQILSWADAHHAATGKWPTRRSGQVRGVAGEHWCMIDEYLRKGARGLPAGSSLARVLDAHRRGRPRPLTLEMIRTWAEAHRAVQGSWPAATAGPVLDAPGEDWFAINYALRFGSRGLPGGMSLAQLFGRSVDRSLSGGRPRLTIDQVLAWGDAHRAATGKWPRWCSGPIPGAPGEKWVNVDMALRRGRRGLPGGTTLTQLFAHRQPPMPSSGRQEDEKE